MALAALRIKIFADGADKASMLELHAKPFIRGFTTNPTLMRRAGVANYRDFARDVLSHIKDRPISFEVLSDEPAEMERQALAIADWADNVYVKIPVSTSDGEPCCALVRRLSDRGVKVNVTAITTLAQVRAIVPVLNPGVASYVSVLAGRIADTGVDPVPLMTEAVRALRANPSAELIWASPREVLNILQAQEIGCHIITVTQDILGKLALLGRSLEECSLDTVRMFQRDSRAAGFYL